MAALVLRELREGDEAALRLACRAFAKADPGSEFAFGFDETVPFADYLERLERRKIGAETGLVPGTFLACWRDEELVGQVSLRHRLNEQLLEYGGHIGFGVVPDARRSGVGRRLLELSLPIARDLQIERVLLTCADDNMGSRRIIEGCGGVLENLVPRAGGGFTRRYWIDL